MPAVSPALLAGPASPGRCAPCSHFPAQPTPGIVGAGLAVAAAVGLAAGYLPARRASNLPVIDALRAE